MWKEPSMSEDNKSIATQDRKSININGLGHHHMGSGD